MCLHWEDTPETPWFEREGQREPVSRPTTVAINDETVIERLSVRKEGGTFKAYVREFPGIRPRSGIIEIRFTSTPGHEAMIQAFEVLPTRQSISPQMSRHPPCQGFSGSACGLP